MTPPPPTRAALADRIAGLVCPGCTRRTIGDRWGVLVDRLVADLWPLVSGETTDDTPLPATLREALRRDEGEGLWTHGST